MVAYVWNGTTGAWDDPTNWTPNGVPGAGDNVTINSGGVVVGTDVTVGNITTDGDSTTELDVGGNFIGSVQYTPPGTLVLTGTLTELGQSGVVVDGTLRGGTIVPGGRGFGFVGGTLDGTTWQGPLAMSYDNTYVNVVNGLTLEGTGGTGPGTLSLTGNSTGLTMVGGGTLDNAAVTLDSSSAFITAGAGTLTLGPNLSMQAGGAVSLNGPTISNLGSIAATNGTLSIGGVLNNAGTVTATGATVALAQAETGGTLLIGAGGTLSLAGGVTAASIVFSAASGQLVLDDTPDFAGTVSGFAAGDVIALPNVSADTAQEQNGSLVLSAGGTQVASLTVTGIADGTQFTLAADGTGVDVALPCFVSGTRIATAAGERAVETLQTGDMVMTARGGMGPAVWIGHREVDCASHPRPENVWPVRVRAGAFGPGRPARDLMLSPDHAVYVDGALVPVHLLIDGELITQVPVDRVSYWHVELPRHDVILAEGLEVESFLDAGNRDSFANGGAMVRLHPEFAAASWENACAPIVLWGERLQQVRARVQDMRRRAMAA